MSCESRGTTSPWIGWGSPPSLKIYDGISSIFYPLEEVHKSPSHTHLLYNNSLHNALLNKQCRCRKIWAIKVSIDLLLYF